MRSVCVVYFLGFGYQRRLAFFDLAAEEGKRRTWYLSMAWTRRTLGWQEHTLSGVHFVACGVYVML